MNPIWIWFAVFFCALIGISVLTFLGCVLFDIWSGNGKHWWFMRAGLRGSHPSQFKDWVP